MCTVLIDTFNVHIKNFFVDKGKVSLSQAVIVCDIPVGKALCMYLVYSHESKFIWERYHGSVKDKRSRILYSSILSTFIACIKQVGFFKNWRFWEEIDKSYLSEMSTGCEVFPQQSPSRTIRGVRVCQRKNPWGSQGLSFTIAQSV